MILLLLDYPGYCAEENNHIKIRIIFKYEHFLIKLELPKGSRDTKEYSVGRGSYRICDELSLFFILFVVERFREKRKVIQI